MSCIERKGTTKKICIFRIKPPNRSVHSKDIDRSDRISVTWDKSHPKDIRPDHDGWSIERQFIHMQN